MRPLVLLTVLAACSAAPTATSQAPPFDPAALVARDRLADPSEAMDASYAPSFDRAVSAELDGAPPREWLIVTNHPVPEAAAAVRIAPYHHDGSGWVALRLLAAGGYMEPGYVEVIDLEGDGQDELLLVGDTDGVSPADLSLVRLVDGAFVDLVWGEDAGAAYVTGDVDGDGMLEIVGLPSLMGQGPPQVLGVAPDGFLRRRTPPPPQEWLPGLLEAALAAPSQQHRLDGLAAAMRHAGASPGPAAVPQLIAAWDTVASWDREPLAVLLGLTGSTQATAFFAERLARMDPEDPHRALGEAAATSGLQDAVLVAFAGRVGADSLGDVRELVQGALPAFTAQGDVRLRDAVAAALRNPQTHADVRGDLVYGVLPLDPGLAPVLIELLQSELAPELTRLTALALERAAGRFAAAPAAWRRVLDVELGRRLLDADSGHTRSAGLDLLLAHDAPLAPDERIARALNETHSPMQRGLIGALPRGGPTAADSPALRLLAGDSQVRRAVHAWIATSDEPARWIEGLGRVTTKDDLEPYSYALQRDPPKTGAAWLPVLQLALGFAVSEHPRFRQRASEMLGGLPGPGSTDRLIALLDDPVIWVRTTAADALARHAGAEAVGALISAAKAAINAPRQDGFLVGELLGSLGSTRRPSAILFLTSLPPETDAGASAVRALSLAGELGGAALDGRLQRLLADPSATCEAVHRTLSLLARTAQDRAAEHLPAVRARTCEEPEADWLPWVIESWERAEALAPISELTEHPSRAVRLAALQAKGRLLRAFAIRLE